MLSLHVVITDINECQQNPCGANAVCTDTVGSFVCSCKEDFTGDPFKGCVGRCYLQLNISVTSDEL